MILGTYKRKIEWENFESPMAFEILKSRVNKSWTYNTCGSGCLSVLTGVPVNQVEKKLPKSAEHWTDISAIKYLEKRGFIIKQLTKRGVTNLSPETNDNEWHKTPLNGNHVLLCNLLMCREEASWWIISNGHSIHNFKLEPLDPMLIINKPPQSMYVVTHKKWK